jgi:3-hydroxybutyrate dehydrogenase
MAKDSETLQGRHAVVTGGARGIGAAVADRLDTLGCKLTLMDLAEDPLASKSESLSNALAVPVDVTDEQRVASAFEQALAGHGPVDILVNCAGIAESAPLSKTSMAMWDRTIAVNLTGTFLATRAALPEMIKRDWGRIVSVVSTAGLIGYAYTPAYCASKHGVIGMTRSLALEVARTGLTVNAICPTFTETELLERTLQNIVDKTGCTIEEAAKQLKKVNPQNRFIQPAEIASTVAWLCLPGSESVTGQAIALAGGEVM